jgi:hypothetical protein
VSFYITHLSDIQLSLTGNKEYDSEKSDSQYFIFGIRKTKWLL